MRLLNLLFGILIGSVFSSAVVIAWSGPTSAPPNGNVAPPINVGTANQVKNGGLSLNTLAVFGNGILTGNFGINNSAPIYRLDVNGATRIVGNTLLSGTSRYLNFGTATSSSGYGFRDNAGVMQFKNSGGTWLSIPTTTSKELSVWTPQSSVVFNASLGATWTDLNLSGVVGAKRALVFLKIVGGNANYVVRTRGESLDMRIAVSNLGGGASSGYGESGKALYLMAQTDSAGYLQIKASNTSSTQVVVEGFISN